LNSKTLPNPILVGREKELEKLKVLLISASKGRGTTVFISGEAGSGKTRLANEFLKIAEEKNARILTAQCLSKAVDPYFPFIEAFEGYSTSIENESQRFVPKHLNMRSLLFGPHQSAENEIANPQAWKDQTFATIAKELVLLSVQKPVVIFIDDIHWADSASLSLLHFISRYASSERIIVLGSFRGEELIPSAEGQPHPLLVTLRYMRCEDLFEEIKLTSLNKSEVVEIARSMIGGNLGEDFAEKLATESSGNPLFVVESLRMLHEQGSLVQRHGEWNLDIDALGIPSKVKEIILQRIGILKSEQRRVLDVASVIGDKFDPELLGEVLRQDSLSVLEILNTISRSNSLVCSEENFFRFDHPKSREVLYEEIRPPLRKGYHARIAERMEDFDQRAQMLRLGEIAYHYIMAGKRDKAIQYSIAAGKEALARFSNIEAIKHFKHVVDSISDTPEFENEKVLALEGLGDAFFANCMYKEALEIFEKLASSREKNLRVRAFRKAMDSAFFQGNFSHLIELTKKAEGFVDLDRLEGARVRMNVGRALSNLERAEEGLANMEGALKTFEEEYSTADTARALMGVAIISLLVQQQEKGLAAAVRSVAMYDELGDFRGQMDANNRAGQAFHCCGFSEEALKRFDKAVEIGSKIHDYNRMAEATAYSSSILENRGDLQGALSRSLRAIEYAKATDSYWTLGAVYSSLVRQYAKLGDLKSAEEYFGKLMTLPQIMLSNPAVGLPLLKAVLFTAKSQWREANSCYEEILKQYGPRPGLNSVITSYAWHLAKQNRPKEAQKQIEEEQKMWDKLHSRLETNPIQCDLMMPKEITTDTEFRCRFDIINITKNPIRLLKIEKLIASEIKISTLPEYCKKQDNTIVLDRNLDSLTVETIKFKLQAEVAGVFKWRPQVTYIDSSGRGKTFRSKTVSLSVNQKVISDEKDTRFLKPSHFEFKCAAAQKAFDFLLNSFVADYKQKRLPHERSGWRTVMDIARDGKVSQYSLYGVSGVRGKAMVELERSGLVETRLFIGERGRGGKIVKVRISSENDFVKRLLKPEKN
jgi:tetratricopeptide (TPR) repeat protein